MVRVIISLDGSYETKIVKSDATPQDIMLEKLVEFITATVPVEGILCRKNDTPTVEGGRYHG